MASPLRPRSTTPSSWTRWSSSGPRRAVEVGEPKPRFAYLFPSRRSALIQVRLRPELSDAERTRTIELVREAVAAPEFKLEQGGKYLTTGVPVIVDGLAREVRSGIFWLLGAALLVMAATLAVVFRTRLRLLPLALALAASAMTFGVLSLTGWGLTMATIAVLPVLIGLAVDYAIQSHARFDEVLERERAGPAAAVPVAAAAGGPTIATAGLATATGFLVLLLSPVPMVRQFGALLVVGIVIALVCAFTAGYAALARFGGERRRPEDLPPVLPRLRGRLARVRKAIGGSRAGPRGGRLRRGRARARRRPRRARGGLRGLAPAQGAARGTGRGGGGVGARHPVACGLRRPGAGALRPAGAARRERAPGGDRRIRRDRRDRARRRHHRPRGDRVDEQVPGVHARRPPVTRTASAARRRRTRRSCARRCRCPPCCAPWTPASRAR